MAVAGMSGAHARAAARELLRATLAAIRRRPSPATAATAASAAARSSSAERLAAALDGELLLDPAGPVVRVRAGDRRPAARPRAPRARLPGSRRRTRRSSASTPRRPGSRRRRGRWRSSSGSAGGRATGSARPSCCCPTTPTSRRCSRGSRAHIPPDAWLVTYNGRGFDWPLLVARYRMARPPAPPPRRPPRPAAVRPPRVPPPDGRRPAADRRDRAARDVPPRRRRGLADPGPLPRLPARRPGRAADARSSATTARTSGRWPGCSAGSMPTTPIRSPGATAPRGDLAGLARAFARTAGSTRRSTASTRRSDRAPAPTRRARRRTRRRSTIAGRRGRRRRSAPAVVAPAPRRPTSAARAGAPSWTRVVEGRLDSPWTAERIAIERAPAAPPAGPATTRRSRPGTT